MGIQSRQILRAHDYMWVLNIVGAQHNSWLPIQLVDAQNLPERVSPPACLGVRNLWAGVGKNVGMFGCVRMPIFCVDMWVRMYIHVCNIFGRADNARWAPIIA